MALPARATRIACAALALGLARGAAALPEDPGPLATTTQTVQIPVAAGVSLATDVSFPASGGPFPAIVLRHGFVSDRTTLADWGPHLASRGVVTLIPTSRAPSAPDPQVDSDDMLALLAWAVDQAGRTAVPLSGKVDGARLAVSGHSAGGLAAVLAASKGPSLRASVLFDPVDLTTGVGAAAAGTTSVPTLALFAEPASCNATGNGRGMAAALQGPIFSLKVLGSLHCDPESPADALCTFGCGAWDAARHREYRRYATAFLLAYLTCDAEGGPWIDGASAAADTAIQILPETARLALPSPRCQGTDAGVPNDAGGRSDAASSPDASGAGDAGAPSPDAALPGAPDAKAPGVDASASSDALPAPVAAPESCSCQAPEGAPSALASLVVVLGAAFARRRRVR